MKPLQYNNLCYISSCICKTFINFLYYICPCFLKKKFKCEICDTRYISKNNLSYHIRKSHSEIFVWGSSKQLKKIVETERLI